MLAGTTLTEHLRATLPAGLALRVYHVSTPSRSSPALFAAPTGHDEEQTYCESHFIGFAVPNYGDEIYDIQIYAVELLIYSTANLTTIFVSKADSSGFVHLSNRPKCTPSLIKILTVAVLDYFIRRWLASPRLVLSLFARSQNQYLFPGSIENVGKHLLDDRQLIKWWCRIVAAVIDSVHYSPSTPATTLSPSAHVVVPGCDYGETRAFFPPSARTKASPPSRWSAGYPVEALVRDTHAPPRCLIPRFPDDPKSRFLTDLDGSKDERDEWRSVSSLDQFWEMMSYRQECSAGRLVGFIWAVFTSLAQPRTAPNGGSEDGLARRERPHEPRSNAKPVSEEALLPMLIQAQTRDEPAEIPDSVPFVENLQAIDVPKTASHASPSSKPTQLVWQERFALPPSGVVQQRENEESSPKGSSLTRVELVLEKDRYDELMEHLLKLDFATEPMARHSSARWARKAGALANVPSWGALVTGEFEVPVSAAAPEPPSDSSSNINVLTGIRKKRKAEPAAVNDAKQIPDTAISTGVTNLIMKKPKV